MLKHLIYAGLVTLCLALSATQIVAQEAKEEFSLAYNGQMNMFDEPRNSAYYLKDGKFTDEEKDEEALYVYQSCHNNAIQNQLYDCSCVSGSFRNARDAEKIMPQSHILGSIYNKKNSTCANVPVLAGRIYTDCMDKSKYYHESSTDEENSKYCSCLANKTTRDFSKNPKLDLRYFGKIKTTASRVCNAAYRRR